MFARLSTAKTISFGPVLDANGAEYTGAVVGDVKICKNNGTPAALNGSATLSHKEVGLYELVLTASDISTVGQAVIVLSKTTYAAPPVRIDVLPAAVYDSLVSGSDNLQVDVTQLSTILPGSAGGLGRFLGRNSHTINWACLLDPNTGTGNWGITDAGSRWFLTHAHAYRVRQTGTVTQVKLYVGSLTATTVIKVQIWREVRSNVYDLVGETQNLIGSLTPNSVNTVAVSIPGVQEGDYVGYMQTGDAGAPYNFFAQTGLTGQNTYYANAQPGTVGYAWESATLGAGVVVRIQLLGRAPHVVGIGDSILAGHPGHYSFAETTDTTDLDAQIPRIVAEAFGGVHQNTGIGSETTTAIAARIATDCVNLRPRLAILQGGVNDLDGGASQATFIANWTTMLNACQAAGVIPIVCLIAPWTNGTNLKMQTRDTWNAALTALAANYTDALVVDFDDAVGVFRAGGAVGNKWDIQSAYSAGDGVHFNALGYGRMSQAIIDKISRHTAIPHAAPGATDGLAIVGADGRVPATLAVRHWVMVGYARDQSNTRDKIKADWMEDLAAAPGPITGAKVTLRRASDGVLLVNEAAMTAVTGSDNSFFYLATGAARLAKGELGEITVKATIGGVERTWGPVTRSRDT